MVELRLLLKELIERSAEPPKLTQEPTLGTRRLDQITTEDIRAVLADLDLRGLSPRTRQQARTILRIALGVAVDDGLLVANAATGKRLAVPQVRREMRVLTGVPVGALLDGSRDDPYGALWAVLVTTGMRLGEALGLSGPTSTATTRRSA